MPRSSGRNELPRTEEDDKEENLPKMSYDERLLALDNHEGEWATNE